MKPRKIFERILTNQRNVDFRDLIAVVEAFGFALERVSGSHHIYRHAGTGHKLNLQPVGKMAKGYQVKQFLEAVRDYNLVIAGDE